MSIWSRRGRGWRSSRRPRISRRADRRARTLAGIAVAALALGFPPPVAAQQPLVTARASRPTGFPLGPAARALLCAPRVADQPSTSSLRLLRSQEGRLRRMYAPDDMLVVSGGLADGLEPGQLFVVRRPSLDRLQPVTTPRDVSGVRTLGVVQIMAASETLATAQAVDMCDGFVEGDYLEPFEPPAGAPTRQGATTPGYQQVGMVLFGDLSRQIAAPGDMMVIDQGTADTVVRGQIVTIFRPALEHGGPVDEVARALVVDVRDATSTIRIEEARDAVFAGDRVAIHPLQASSR